MVGAWEDCGVHPHTGKTVDNAANAEVQGAVVANVNPSMRLSDTKEDLLFRGTLMAATCYRPARRTIERVMGKHSHAHGFWPCLRSIGSRTHRWVHAARQDERLRPVNNESCLVELLMMATFLPHAVMNFCAPWCTRVEASDASPGGHGRAYTTVPEETVRSWAQVAAHRGDYTSLLESHEMKLPPPEAPAIQLVNIPAGDFYWHEIPREGHHRNIAIEEHAAFFWSGEARADRPAELGVRAVHLGDNAVPVGAHAKGRSSPFMIKFGRKDAAVQIATNNTLFEIRVPSKRNPADCPSSK